MVTITVIVAVIVSTDSWGIQSTPTDARPPLNLSLTGAGLDKIKVGQPKIITVRLVNPGEAAQDSRLRLFIHDGEDREVTENDIEVDIQQNGWKEVPLELIDGGIMGAIGAAGSRHDERHKRGGFAIPKEATKVWNLRMRFHKPGHYLLVLTVSPNNGATHLVQPISTNMEVRE
ncbi:MAG: hypothetical protein V3U88_10160 [Methylococcales bacterium]